MSFVSQQKGLTGMKVFAVAVALSVTLAAAPSYAQAAAGQARPSAPAGQTPPGSPRPSTPATAAPATPAPAPQQAQAPRPPFPTGVKYAFVYVQKIVAESADGKSANDKIQALQQQKMKELSDKQKALQTAQQKLDQGGSVLNDAARQLQEDFQRRLSPVVAKVAQDKQLHMIFSVTDSGLVWGDPALDLTDDVIKALNDVQKK